MSGEIRLIFSILLAAAGIMVCWAASIIGGLLMIVVALIIGATMLRDDETRTAGIIATTLAALILIGGVITLAVLFGLKEAVQEWEQEVKTPDIYERFKKTFSANTSINHSADPPELIVEMYCDGDLVYENAHSNPISIAIYAETWDGERFDHRIVGTSDLYDGYERVTIPLYNWTVCGERKIILRIKGWMCDLCVLYEEIIPITWC